MVKLSFFPRLSTAKPAPSNNAQSKKNVQTIMEKSPDKNTEKSINTSGEKSLDSIIEGKTGIQISPVSKSAGNKKSLQIIEIGKNISPKTNVKKYNDADKTSLQIIEIGKNISPNLKSNAEESPIQKSSITVLQKSVDGRLIEVGKSLPKIKTSISGKKPFKRTNLC